MATVANSTPNSSANLMLVIRRFFAPSQAPSINVVAGLSLIERRLQALQGSAPTWHPLHLQRVVDRTVVEPLRVLLPHTDGRIAECIRDALWELSAADCPEAAVHVLDEATLLLCRALAGGGR